MPVRVERFAGIAGSLPLSVVNPHGKVKPVPVTAAPASIAWIGANFA
jgi:hypothetical protein